MTVIARAYEHLKSKPADSSRIPDFLLGLFLTLPISLSGDLTLSVLAMCGCVALASLRRPSPGDQVPWWFPTILVAMIGWLTISMVYNHLNAYRSLAYFTLWAMTTLVLATGRLDRLSLCRGIGLGLVIGALAGFAGRFLGIGAGGYEGRLTGAIWGDPNQAGYAIAVLGAVALVGVRSGWHRRAFLAVIILALVLTLSRTSLLAMTIGAVWFLTRRRLSPVLSLGVVAGAAWLIDPLLERFVTWGPFATREGSDQLRERIDAAAQQAVQINPWIGRGPGTAHVQVEGNTFFFHNAYLAVRNNGGWILLGLLLLLIALVAVSLLRLPANAHHPWHEAALLALLVVAASLGEVFLRAPAAVAIGLAMRHAINPFELLSATGDDAPDHVL